MFSPALQSAVQLNFLPLGIILFLIFFMRINHKFESDLTHKFELVVILLFILVIADNCDYMLQDTMGIDFNRRFVTMAGYDIRLFLMASLLKIPTERYGSNYSWTLYIPALVSSIICSLSLFTNLVFWYDEQGFIQRGFFAYTPHLTCALYVFYLVALGSLNIRAGKSEEGFIIILCSILTTLGVIVELTFSLRGILIGVIALDITFYYLYLHIEHFKYDPLTGCFNRSSFYADVDRFGSDKIIAILSIDLNNLKAINDNLGHLEGDKAIKYVSSMLRKNLYKGCYLYRVGGDEFTVLCTKQSYSAVLRMIDELRISIGKSRYTCAIGVAKWTSDKSFKEVYSLADKEMYKNKSYLKSC